MHNLCGWKFYLTTTTSKLNFVDKNIMIYMINVKQWRKGEKRGQFLVSWVVTHYKINKLNG
jgi:hypothetical protein